MSAYNTYVGFPQKTSGDGRISLGYAIGNSMSPLIVDGNLIVVYKTKNVEVGDVILFQSGFKYMTHRVIKKNRVDKKLLTKGDNLLDADKPLSPHQMLGKVVAIIQSGDKLKHEKNVFNTIEKAKDCYLNLNRILAFFSFIQWRTYSLVKHKSKILGYVPRDFRDLSLMVFHFLSNPVLALIKICYRITF